MYKKLQLVVFFSSLCSVVSVKLEAFDQVVLSDPVKVEDPGDPASLLSTNTSAVCPDNECCPYKPGNACIKGWGQCDFPNKYVCKLQNTQANIHCTGFIIDAKQLGLVKHPRSYKNGKYWYGAVLITNSECVKERLGNCKNRDCPPIDIICPFWPHCPPGGMCMHGGFQKRLTIEDFLDIGTPAVIKAHKFGKIFKTDWPKWDKSKKHRAGVSIHHINNDSHYNGGGFQLKASVSVDQLTAGNYKLMGYAYGSGNNDPSAYAPQLLNVKFQDIPGAHLHEDSKTIPFQNEGGNYKAEWGLLGAPMYEVVNGVAHCLGVVLRPLVEVRATGWFQMKQYCGYSVERIDKSYTELMNAHLTLAAGDPHMTTLDGANYHFMGECEYYMVKSDNQEFSVSSKMGRCAGVYRGGQMKGQPRITCTKWNKIRTSTAEVKIGPGSQVAIKVLDNNGVWVNINNPRLPWSNGELEVATGRVEVKSLGILVTGTSNVRISLPEGFETNGLLGNNNGDKSDDYMYPNGTVFTPPTSAQWNWGDHWKEVPIEFGNAWRVPDDSSCDSTQGIRYSLAEQQIPAEMNKAMKSAELECAIINQPPFSNCNLPRDTYRESCTIDVMECINAGDSNCDEFLCEQLAAYADICEEDLQHVNAWRTTVQKCTMSCPAGSVYQTCVDSCGYDCASIVEISGVPQDVMCAQSVCLEGCQCTGGKVLSDGQCIARSSC